MNIRKRLILLLFIFIGALAVSRPAGVFAEEAPKFTVDLPQIIVQHVSCNVDITLVDPEFIRDYDNSEVRVLVNGEYRDLVFKDATASIPVKFSQKQVLELVIGQVEYRIEVMPIPLWTSILPPLIAILMALIFKEVFTALFLGLLIGTTIISFYQGNVLFIAVFKGVFAIVDTYILQSLSDEGHLSIIVFSMMIGAMVSLITHNGGMKGVVDHLAKYAKGPKSGQFITWLLGLIIFFDDYANTLVVGNTMRPVTDRLRISREKLAYIVDSTAAPVASIAFVTTWIGAELSYIQDGIDSLGLNENAYNVFFNSLAYSFYPVFALALILILIFRNADFGPMLKAERAARGNRVPESEQNSSSDAVERRSGRDRWFNAVIPVLVIILGTLAGLLYTGWDANVWDDPSIGFATKLSATIGQADSYKALLWSSLSGVLTALLLTISQRILSLKKSIDSLVSGFKTMLTAVLILTLAWALALVTQHMHTAEFISQSMLKLSISPYFIPAITFFLASVVSFSTGSSWGTMAILYPLLLPTTWLISAEYQLDHDQSLAIFYNVVSGVLAGSVLGDHCSPISDTTILSSLASSCNHIEHVRTQLPYALTAGAVAMLVGTIPAAYGVSSLILFPAGIMVLYLVVRFAGKKIDVTTRLNRQTGG